MTHRYPVIRVPFKSFLKPKGERNCCLTIEYVDDWALCSPTHTSFLPYRSCLLLTRISPSPATTLQSAHTAFPRSSPADLPSFTGSPYPPFDPFDAFDAFDAHPFELRQCTTTSRDTVLKTTKLRVVSG